MGSHIVLCFRFFFIKFVVVPQHGPLSLYTQLEGPLFVKLDLSLHDLKGPQIMVMGHGRCLKGPEVETLLSIGSATTV